MKWKLTQIYKVFSIGADVKSGSFFLSKIFKLFSTVLVRKALLVQGLSMCLVANALDLDVERERIRQEVIQNTPDQTLIDALTEIRFKREVLMKLDAVEKSKFLSAVTASVGRENSLGYEYGWKNSVHGFKVEFNWRESRAEDALFDASTYVKHTSYRSVGTYYVLRPFDNGFRVMTGLRFNDINSTYAVSTNGLANVNGNRVTLSAQDHLNYSFSFPRVTPYLGIGFVAGSNNEGGLAFFADAGAMFGRYNAQADTSISKSLNVDVKQVENELNALRNEKFFKRYLWTAKVGLRYSY